MPGLSQSIKTSLAECILCKSIKEAIPICHTYYVDGKKGGRKAERSVPIRQMSRLTNEVEHGIVNTNSTMTSSHNANIQTQMLRKYQK